MLQENDVCLRRQWKISQQLTDQWWQRWTKEYLPTLTRRTKWYKPVTPIIVGDVVIVLDENPPRNVWPKAVVIKTFPSKNGQIRYVDIKTSNGILLRPVSKLYKLVLSRMLELHRIPTLGVIMLQRLTL